MASCPPDGPQGLRVAQTTFLTTHGRQIDLVLTWFADTLMVVISESGKMGSLTLSVPPAMHDPTRLQDQPTPALQTVLGGSSGADPLIDFAAMHLHRIVLAASPGERRTLMIALAIKPPASAARAAASRHDAQLDALATPEMQTLFKEIFAEFTKLYVDHMPSR
ncbi:hypothetical protein CXG81DRAFT_26709 [Caulochytrium protostelioides]|uniref:Proteasome assembly chaperone 3 n=1 Tax=Caulochytrium protostelioides TaxID=1555241 RepID=A0A4V1IUH4_9FUNG|nr:hypothetical protein CXG81DRAFT_26709 [Caulochytrium protostelioides]|eukprot:RKP00569.1 hypothetical protein CXG81DRAFT_26709 [Caulochytrium protostelioides]